MYLEQVLVRRMEIDDLKEVGEVVNCSILPSVQDYDPVLIKKKLERNNADNFLNGRESVEYYVAALDREILGLIGLESNEIRTFYVDPKYQGQGVGRLLYSRILELVSERDIKELTVRSSPVAKPIYKRLGFKTVKKIWKTEDGTKSLTILMVQKF